METPKTEEILYRRVSVKEKGYPKTSGYYFVIDNEFNSTYRFDSGESRFYYGTEYKNPTHWLEPYSDQQAGVRVPTDEEIEKIFPTDTIDSGEDDNSEQLNHCNKLRQEGAKWLRSQLKPSQSQEGEEAVEFAEWIDRCVFNADDETDQFMLSNGLKYFVFDNKT